MEKEFKLKNYRVMKRSIFSLESNNTITYFYIEKRHKFLWWDYWDRVTEGPWTYNNSEMAINFAEKLEGFNGKLDSFERIY